MEASSSQQLCTLGNPANAGESHSAPTDIVIPSSDQHGGFSTDADINPKVCCSNGNDNTTICKRGNSAWVTARMPYK